MNKNLKAASLQIIGLLLYSFGVAGVVFTGLGASPIDAATYYINELIPIFNGLIPGFTGQGIWLIVFNVLIAFGLLSITKDNRLWFTIIVSVASGLLFNTAFFLYEKMFNITGVMSSSQSIVLRIALAILFINLMASGIAILAAKKLFGTPFDELTIFVETKLNKYFLSKIILDGSFLIIAFILGIIYKGVFKQIGVFTIVILGVLGPLINVYISLINKKIERRISI